MGRDAAGHGAAIPLYGQPLTQEERRLLGAYRELPARERANLLAMMECYGDALEAQRARAVVSFPKSRADKGGRA